MKIPDKALVIDGNNFCFRLYFSNRTKEITEAFFSYLSVLINKFKMAPIFCFDYEGKSWRKDLYPDYKANRPISDDVLAVKDQIREIQKFLSEIGIPFLKFENYEADDIIACLCKNFLSESIIISTDKDLLQLLDDNTSVYIKDDEYTIDDFMRDYGFNPKYFPEYRAIIGDSSDNIKGVPGVGEKRLQELIEENGMDGERIFMNCSSSKYKKVREMSQYRDIYLRNLELMSLEHIKLELILRINNVYKIAKYNQEKMRGVLRKRGLLHDESFFDDFYKVIEFFSDYRLVS